MTKITLEQAVEIVRELQPLVRDSGYYLALAGGTLNKGSSDNDIDLVAMPSDSNAQVHNLMIVLANYCWLKSKGEQYSRGRPVRIYHYVHRATNIPLDIAVVRSHYE